jgi:hypothetical protein
VTGNLRVLSPIRCSSRQTSRRAGLVARSLSVAHSPGGNWACCCAGPLAAGKLRHVLRRGPLRDRGRLLRRALRVVRAISRWHPAPPWPQAAGVGGDHGIEHTQNWLRFPYVSIFYRPHNLHPRPQPPSQWRQRSRPFGVTCQTAALMRRRGWGMAGTAPQ